MVIYSLLCNGIKVTDSGHDIAEQFSLKQPSLTILNDMVRLLIF